MLTVISVRDPESGKPLSECPPSIGIQKAQVTIETDHTDPNKAHDELNSGRAADMAVQAAVKEGVRDPRIDRSAAVYTVDAAGQLIQWAPGETPAKVDKFRADILLCPPLV